MGVFNLDAGLEDGPLWQPFERAKERHGSCSRLVGASEAATGSALSESHSDQRPQVRH